MCHSAIAEQFNGSVHGQAIQRGALDAPVCTSCHTAHMVLPPSSLRSTVNPAHVRETCAQCHGNVRLSRRYGLPPDRILSFDASFHGMALKEGDEMVANCASCHGIHNILASSNPQSTINPKNLPATCGKCHAGAGRRFALGTIHELQGRIEPSSVRWARQFYLLVIPLTLGLMFLHHLGDWVHKLIRLRFRPGGEPADLWRARYERSRLGPVRMYGVERIEHALLLVSFSVLTWTGFALKYPDTWWTRPLHAWEITWPLRGTVHRIAAVVFMALVAAHVVSLVKSARLRRHWKELWPRINDLREGMSNFAYNLGLRSERPQISPHSYVEKVEYWAVVWGAGVMIATGLMLWANRFTLRWFPKSALDFATAVHFYEAVLAVSAVVIWHFYSVIFDPDVYPLETAWLTGRSVKRRQEETAEGITGEHEADTLPNGQPQEVSVSHSSGFDPDPEAGGPGSCPTSSVSGKK
jgi:cytochrome b subunit of formate dehydrogenase